LFVDHLIAVVLKSASANQCHLQKMSRQGSREQMPQNSVILPSSSGDCRSMAAMVVERWMPTHL